jgi:PAS domain S-box-containing protein
MEHDKEKERKLLQSQKMWEEIFDKTNDIITIHDKDFNIIRANKAARRMFGLKLGDFGTKCYKAYHGVDKIPEDCPANSNPVKKEAVFERYEPSLNRYLEYRIIPYHAGDCLSTGCIHIVRDITARKKAEEILKESEARFKELADLLPQPICEVDKEGNFIYANQIGLKTFGYTQKDIDNCLNVLQIFAPEERERVASNILKRLKGKEFEGHEYLMMKEDGSTFPALLYTSAILRSGKPVGVRGVLVDITYRVKAEEEIKKHSYILSNMAEGVNVTDTHGVIRYTNASFERIFGYDKGELIGKNISILNASDEEKDKAIVSEVIQALNQKGFWTGEFRNRRKDGSVFHTLTSISEIELSGEKHWISVQEDITERIELEQSLRKALNEKDVLMKEIHHRVKNNLGVIQSLLSLQLHDVSDEKSRAYFKDARNRVKSMSMIHERLSRSEELSKMDLSEFIKSLANHLFQSSGLNPSKVKLDVNVPEITIDVETMMPCGLIINELVSNAFKYAFPDDRAGAVTIGLVVGKDNEITLSVKDDGVGISDDLNIYETKSLGLQIVSALTNQIQGNLELIKGHGTEIRITFKEKRFR